jgi:hypothetical protein
MHVLVRASDFDRQSYQRPTGFPEHPVTELYFGESHQVKPAL